MTDNYQTERMDQDAQLADLNQQTAKIAFQELQRFYASGNVLHIDRSLDLVAVGHALVRDDSESVAEWKKGRLITALADELALEWIETDAVVWALVVAPFVLVQGVAG